MKNVLILIVLLIAAGVMGVVSLQKEPEPEAPSIPKVSLYDEVPMGAPKRKRGFTYGTGGGGGSSMTPKRRTKHLLHHFSSSMSRQRCLRVAAEFRASFQQTREFLADILADETHENHEHVIEIVGLMREPSFLDAIARIAKTGKTTARIKALEAYERIQPWPDLEVENFLRDPEKPVVLAMLILLQKRRDPLPSSVLPLLESADTDIRDAALRALPKHLQKHDRETLYRFIDLGSVDTARAALRALASTELNEKLESSLYGALASPDRQQRVLALDLLTKKGYRLHKPKKVWRPALVSTFDDFEHARALYCLEITKSFDASSIEKTIDQLGALPRYFAARCLLAGGHVSGARYAYSLLVSLEEELALSADAPEDGDTYEVGRETKTLVMRDLRMLMGRLAHTGPYVDNEKWETWLDDLTRLPARRLGPHSVTLR